MPTYPRNIKCSMLGCQNQRSKLNSYCGDHGGLDYMEAKDSDSRYQTAAWRSIRMGQLSKQPLCQACLTQGMITAAKHIDHLFPWRQVGGNSFSRNIFQSLCPEHHSYKTGQEKQGNVLHFTRDGVITYAMQEYEQVMHSAGY